MLCNECQSTCDLGGSQKKSDSGDPGRARNSAGSGGRGVDRAEPVLERIGQALLDLARIHGPSLPDVRDHIVDQDLRRIEPLRLAEVGQRLVVAILYRGRQAELEVDEPVPGLPVGGLAEGVDRDRRLAAALGEDALREQRLRAERI